MSGYNRPPDLLREIRRTNSRLGELERGQLASEDAEWQVAALAGPFTNFGSGYADAAYYKDTFGRVYVRGRVDVGAAVGGETVFPLAEEFRPAFIHDFTLVSGSFENTPVWATATVNPDGTVVFNGSQVESVPLDVIQFRTS